MRKTTDWRRATVTATHTVAEGVRRIEFAVPGVMPPFDPGSHTNLRVTIDGAPAIRTYTCTPARQGHIAVAVKLHPQSRGGSRFMWELQEGDSLELSMPENRFELSWRAGSYLLIAGGIGVTPIYGMAGALAARSAEVRMVYGGASRAVMPFAGELETMLGDRLDLRPSDEGKTVDLDAEIARLPEDGELYICGPLGMLDAARDAWGRAGRPVSRFRCEVFGDNGKFAEQPFEVDVVNEGITVPVRPDQSLLDALMAAGVDMVYDCERGECGLCAVDVIECEGEIDHRDVFFSDAEKQENRRMCACVSRLVGGRAKIDVGYRL